MHIKVPSYDHRAAIRPGVAALCDDAGKQVGKIAYSQGPTMNVSLFGGKYRGEFHSDAEAEAFVRGVEAVLNHAVSLD